MSETEKNYVQIKEWKFPPFNVLKKRLQEAGIGLFPNIPSRKSWKKAIKGNRVKVNGKLCPTSTWVHIGDLIEILPDKRAETTSYKMHKKQHQEIEICHEDSELIIVVKPAGIPTSGNFKHTLCSVLRKHLNSKDIHPSHRLDKSTHGLVVFHKNIQAANWLGEAFKNRAISKTYFALAVGEIHAEKIEIMTQIDGRNSHSVITNLGTINWPVHNRATFVQITPLSGRKHQIRKHLNHIGHPIVGDTNYNQGLRFKGQGLFLSCTQLSFRNQKTGELIEVETDLPKKFKQVLYKLDFP